MVDQRRKMQRQAAKERAKVRRAAERDKDTIYWLVFEPRTDVPVPPKEKDFRSDPWRVHIGRNPEGYPELIERAIATFETKFSVKSWKELAVRYYIDSLYFP